VSLAKAILRLLRMDLHARAFDLHSHGRTEAAQAVWSVVEALDDLLNRLNARRR
jgi:hypothetical protein